MHDIVRLGLARHFVIFVASNRLCTKACTVSRFIGRVMDFLENDRNRTYRKKDVGRFALVMASEAMA